MRFTEAAQVSDALGIRFSKQQLDAITARLEPGVIIAGAGTGKTAVMAARVVWLVGTGQVRPDQVLGLTFTRKAAAELSQRVKRALTQSGAVTAEDFEEGGEQLITTYDSFASRLVADYGLRLGVADDVRLLSEAARWQVATRVVREASGPFPTLSEFSVPTIIERLLGLDAALTSHLVGTEAIREQAAEFERALDEAPLFRGKPYAKLAEARVRAQQRNELTGLVDAYAALKLDRGLVEFADQMATAAALAQRVPSVSRELREQFKVVLLDEYQDTSNAQVDLLRALFSGPTVDEGRGHPVTAVGDPFQAIYGWRGAAASNITQVATEFPRADGRPAESFALTINRRSGQTILNAANALSTPLRDDPMLEEVPELDLVAPEGTPPGVIEQATFDTWPDEVAWLADEIVRTRAAGVVGRWRDMAVLTRRNAELGAVYAELVERGVPAEIVGLTGLLAVPEVAEVMALLRVLSNPSDNPALVKVLTGTRWAIGPADLAALGRRAEHLAGASRAEGAAFDEQVRRAVSGADAASSVSLAEALEDLGAGEFSAEGRARMEECAAELRRLRRHAGEPVPDIVRRVIVTMGLDVELASLGADRDRQLAAFQAAVAEFDDVDGDRSLAALVRWLDMAADHERGLEQELPTQGDAVQLLTMHRAKGLEWECVFLPAMAETVFPSNRASGNWLTAPEVVPAELRGDAASIPQVAEVTNAGFKAYTEEFKRDARLGDDRLAYVAVTRARQRLVVSTHAWASGRKKPLAPSSYLEAIAPFARVVRADPVSPENPLGADGETVAWPVALDAEAAERRRVAAAEVEAARGRPVVDAAGLSREDADLVQAWDAAADVLVTEARASRDRSIEVVLPRYLSATALVQLRTDPNGWALNALRPMPQAPARRAREGEQFHAWLEQRFAQVPTLLPDEEPVETDATLAELQAAFERGMFAGRTPEFVEVPFSVLLAGQVIRGRIDAVFTDRGNFEIVDWKTGDARRSDPLQLALYRLAWAELHGVEPDAVSAAFYDVRRDRLITFDELPGRVELESLLA